MAAEGLRWCRGCARWMQAHLVFRQGACRPCQNAEQRHRYATNPVIRERIVGYIRRRERGVAPVPRAAGADLMDDFEGECAYCDRPAETFDHVVAVRWGGETEPPNIVPACRSCNSSKRDRDVWEWLEATGRTAKEAMVSRVHDGGCGLLS